MPNLFAEGTINLSFGTVKGVLDDDGQISISQNGVTVFVHDVSLVGDDDCELVEVQRLKIPEVVHEVGVNEMTNPGGLGNEPERGIGLGLIDAVLDGHDVSRCVV